MFGTPNKKLPKLITSLLVLGLVLTSCGKNISSNPVGNDTTTPIIKNTVAPTVSMQVATGIVTGKVIDSTTNLGVPNVKVEVKGFRPAISTLTDASGNYKLSVPTGKVVLLASKDSFTSLSGNTNITVTVEAGKTTSATTIYVMSEDSSAANGFVKSFDGLEFPKGVTIDKENETLYVVDVIGAGGILTYDRAEVKKMNTDGGILTSFGSRIISKDLRDIDLLRLLKKSTGVGVDAGGNVYVADTGNNVIKKYGPTGLYITTIKKDFKNLIDIEVLTTGDVLVSDPGNARVVLLDSSGNVKIENILGTNASDGVKGIACDLADNIYVIDSSATPGNVIKKFDKNGNRLSLQFGIIGGLQSGYFNDPTDLAIDNRNGDIYIVDSGNNRIQRFNSEGKFLSEFGHFGSEDGNFSTPWGIAVDKSGFVYISDTKNARVEKFMPGRATSISTIPSTATTSSALSDTASSTVTIN